MQTRREFARLFGGSLLATAFFPRWAKFGPTFSPYPFRIRTITAGVDLSSLSSLRAVEDALNMLGRAKAVFTDLGYEVQTLRITTPPLFAGQSAQGKRSALRELYALDQLLESRGASGSIGPVLTADEYDPAMAEWLVELISGTRRLSASVVVASPEHGVQYDSVRTAADIIVALAGATPDGLGNFRFAASANIPAGTPFFPVGYHRGPGGLALGLESPSLVETAVAGVAGPAQATPALVRVLNEALVPMERTLTEIAQRERRVYLGIDTSPAPGLDRSIGGALEALIGAPFGSPATLAACSAVTTALQAVAVKTCGYCGLMLPVLEDPVLAKRANEGRFGMDDVLLWSSVCGTGLDLIPLPGDTPTEVVSRIVLDVAALSARWKKPLSARLFPVPGKSAGEIATFDDPLLTDCKVFAVE